jgi:hypothetical protein
MRAGSLADFDGLVQDLAAIAGAPSTWIAAHPEVDCSLFEDAAGAPRVLFCGNRSSAPITTRVVVSAGVALADGLTGAPADPDAVALGPHDVRMLAIRAI